MISYYKCRILNKIEKLLFFNKNNKIYTDKIKINFANFITIPIIYSKTIKLEIFILNEIKNLRINIIYYFIFEA